MAVFRGKNEIENNTLCEEKYEKYLEVMFSGRNDFEEKTFPQPIQTTFITKQFE